MLLQMPVFHFFMTNSPLYIYIYIYISHLLYTFICQWTFKLLPCFGYCKYGVHVSFQVRVFSGYMLRRGLLLHMVTFSFFKGTSILSSIVAAPIYIPTNSF